MGKIHNMCKFKYYYFYIHVLGPLKAHSKNSIILTVTCVISKYIQNMFIHTQPHSSLHSDLKKVLTESLFAICHAHNQNPNW